MTLRLPPLALTRPLAALATAVMLTFPAAAQSRGPVVQAEILPGWQTPDGRRMAALRIDLPGGWHTYWRNPGEVGIAPRLDWSESQNVAAVTPIWPRPRAIEQNGYVSYGYYDQLILPLEITPRDPARPMALAGTLALGVCHDICVPADLTVSGALRGAGGPDARIEAALATQAQPPESAGLTRATCRLEPAARGAELTLRATLPHQGTGERLIVELPGSGLRVTELRSWRDGGDIVARARLRAPGGGPVSFERGALSYTVLSEARMISAEGCTAN